MMNTERTENWDFFRSVSAHRKHHTVESQVSVTKHYKGDVRKAALSATSGVTGGYLVPMGYETLLLRSIEENSIIRPRAQVVPMTTRETICPKPRTTGSGAAGTTPFFGGLKFTWGEAGGAITESEPAFDAITLTARDLIGQLVASNQFVMDIGEEGERKLTELFGKAAAFYEDYAFFNGTGVANNQPIGILNANCRIPTTRAGAGHIAQADIAKMVKSLIPYSWASSIWACSPTALEDVVKATSYVPNMNFNGVEGGSVGNLLTRPLFVTEKLPALGTAGDLVFFDPSLYVIGDRAETIVDISDQVLFRTYQSVWKIWRRTDGKPLLDTAVTLADGSSTASSIVVLN